MDIAAAQFQRCAIEQEALIAVNRHRADAEGVDHLVGHGAVDHHLDDGGSQLRRLRRPGLRIGHLQRQHGVFLFAVGQACLFEISDMLGFSSASVFTRFFSHQTGMLPSHFKARHCRR